MTPFQEKGTFDENKMVRRLFSSIQICSSIDKGVFGIRWTGDYRLRDYGKMLMRMRLVENERGSYV